MQLFYSIIVVGKRPIHSVIVRSQFVCDVLQFATLSFIGIVNILSIVVFVLIKSKL